MGTACIAAAIGAAGCGSKDPEVQGYGPADDAPPTRAEKRKIGYCLLQVDGIEIRGGGRRSLRIVVSAARGLSLATLRVYPSNRAAKAGATREQRSSPNPVSVVGRSVISYERRDDDTVPKAIDRCRSAVATGRI